MQFTLRSTFVVIGFFALSLVALRFPTIWAASLSYSIAWTVVVFAAVVASIAKYRGHLHLSRIRSRLYPTGFLTIAS